MTPILLDALDRFAGARIAVVGDVMLDSYLVGRAGRLCREAPVPIVSVLDRHDAPGGAANAAANAARLGARVRLLGIVGRDEPARRLRTALRSHEVHDADLVAVPGHATLAKQRITADGQLLVRFDEGTAAVGDDAVTGALLAALPDLHAWADAIVVSDYGYGVVADAVVDRLAALQRQRPRVVVVDAKDPRRLAPVRPTAVKPNYAEASELLGLGAIEPAGRVAAIVGRAAELFALTGAENAVVTIDADGAVLLRRGAPPHRTYARPAANDHAAGAGDTVAATLALALASGSSPVEAVELASVAASVAVAKPWTATCATDELRAALAGTKRSSSVQELRRRLDLERALGRRIVFTNGCFDILHPGHVDYLNRAKALGDVLVVAVNGDASVRRLKGEHRPVNTLGDRMEVLAGLACVDHLVAFDEDTPHEVIRAVRPDVVTKGGDYDEQTLPEAALVRELGGEVRILPFVPNRSTSQIIERIGAGIGRGGDVPAAVSGP